MSFGWGTILDTQETFECEKPNRVAVLDTLKPVHMAPTTIPRSTAPQSLLHPLIGTHNPYLNCFKASLLPLLYTRFPSWRAAGDFICPNKFGLLAVNLLSTNDL
jgi:hypothetical protein